MITTWHLQKPAIALGTLTSGDNHFTYTIKQDGTDEEMRTTLATIGESKITAPSGVTKLPDKKQVFGNVYNVNIPPGKTSMFFFEIYGAHGAQPLFQSKL